MNLTHLSIRKAVFPVAGARKKRLTVVNNPLIQYAVKKTYALGVQEVLFVA